MTSAVSGLRALTPARTAVVSGVPRLAPWLIPLVIAAVALHTVDVPAATVARYALYFAGCVVLPGVLLMRAVWRSTGNWAEDVGVGAAVGFGYELVGWAIFTALGWQSALVVWPLLVLACFAAVPKLRRNWLIAEPAPLPVLWSWGVALCVAVLVAAAFARNGIAGRRYTVQPSPWPDRTALTNQVLAAPTAEVLDRLYRDFGVRWIYADGHHGKVSPELDRLAVLRYEVSRVRIYQIPAR